MWNTGDNLICVLIMSIVFFAIGYWCGKDDR